MSTCCPACSAGSCGAPPAADAEKTKNLRRDPRVTFFILDPANPFRTLEIRADAVLHPARVVASRIG